jgi:hypothetical protein
MTEEQIADLQQMILTANYYDVTKVKIKKKTGEK